ncbi:MAG: iron reductase [Ktedonobacterales bacterium]
MTLWETVTWDIARAGGFTAYGLLAAAVIVGLALSMQWQTPRWPRLVNSELHNFLTLLALIFTALHVLAVWLDPFTHFTWLEMLIPFTSYYRPTWMALGIVAFYLGIAIGISTWVRPAIGYALWRKLHVLTLAIFALTTVHGMATGSDTQTWWALAIYIVSALAVTALLCVRLLKTGKAHARGHPKLAAATALVVLIGVVWALMGPLQSGWSSRAGTHSAGTHSAASSAITAATVGASYTPPTRAQKSSAIILVG